MNRASVKRALESTTAKVVFLAVVLGCAWWGFGSSGEEVLAALRETSFARVLGGQVLVVAGLLLTGLLWRTVLAGYGYALPWRAGMAIFFVGQLGKYVPGSVWSLGVQAKLAAAHRVPARATVAASLVFLVLHVTTGGLVVALLGAWTEVSSTLRVALVVGGALLGATALCAPLTRWAGERLAGPGRPLRWGPAQVLIALAVMSAVWTCYCAALVALVPDPSARAVASISVAFALGYVAGVAVPFAPAGLGAREGVFLLVLAPTLGVAGAASLAILARVLHTIGDFLVAGLTWLVARHAEAERVESGMSEGPA